MSPDDRDRIEGFQPYDRGNDVDGYRFADPDDPIAGPKHPLYWLRELSNIDKHQRLHTTFGNHSPVGIGGFGSKDDVVQSTRGLFASWATELGAEVVEVGDFSGENPKQNHYSQAMFYIALANGEHVDRMLDSIGQEVARIVSAFEPGF